MEEREGGGNSGDVGEEEGALATTVTELTTARVRSHILKDAVESSTAVERMLRLGDEEKCHPPLFQHDFLTAQLSRYTT